MISFLKINKNLFTYIVIGIIVIPIFGFKLFISILGNILLLTLLIPLLVLLLIFIFFGSFKSSITFLEDLEKENYQFSNDASEETIEIEAEEIK